MSATLQKLASNASPQTSQYLASLQSAFEKKLYHNLTLLLVEFVSDGETGPLQVELYEGFIQPIEKTLNPLRLVKIARAVASQYQDPHAALAFLQNLHSRLDNPSFEGDPEDLSKPFTPPAPPAAEAYALSHTAIAYAQLLTGDLVGSKASLASCEAILSGLDGIEPQVNASYYEVSADYYKIKADYVAFYKSSLLYLACVDLGKDLTQEQQVSRAHDLAIAALLGESIYNFGELLQHPLLNALDGSQFEWLKQLLFVFNAGDLGKYDVLSQRLQEEPILAGDAEFLRQKICLMAMIEVVFKRPRNQRSMKFEVIGQETRLPVNEVEHLIMKALSLKLIRGAIDQVNGIAAITWVQPRVLDADQGQALGARLTEWTESVGKVGGLVNSYRQPLAV